MMKKLALLLTVFPLIFLAGCFDGDVSRINPPDNQEETNQMVLGEKLENPYSVDNMRRAYAELAPGTRSLAGDPDIDELIYPTHLYVVFKPVTESDLGILKSDSTLILYPYPLDYEIISYGEYRDPSVPEDQPTHYYASVPVDKELTGEVEWEIIEYLYIPDEYGIDDEPVTRTLSGASLNEMFIESLVDKALEITGNEEPAAATRAKSNWRPAGKITYEDDITRATIGMEGIKVKARRWFTTHTGYVNAAGNYSCDGTFKRDANYSFDLERYDFHVKGDGVRTDYDGPKQTGNWDYTFWRNISQTNYFAATIFRAAYHYYYKDIGGLRRPPMNDFWKTQMKLKAYNETNTEGNGAYNPKRRFLGMGNPIKLYNPKNPTVEIYASTIHELSHSAHWRMIVDAPDTKRYRDYHYAEDKMVESWACGVQYYLTRMVYPDYQGRDEESIIYTNVVIDLIDTEADAATNNGLDSSRGDNVTGYTMRQIEDALIGVDTWIKWRNNIKNRYNNATKNNVDALFAAW